MPSPRNIHGSPRLRRFRATSMRCLVLGIGVAVCIVFSLNIAVASRSGNASSLTNLRHRREPDDDSSVDNSFVAPTPVTSFRPSRPTTSGLMDTRRIVVLIANYRDSVRCAETLNSLFTQADRPDLLALSIFDQLNLGQNEARCFDAYCSTAGEASCRRSQLRFNDTIDADEATGPTMARYRTEAGIDLDADTFSLSIDSHLVFVPHWDTDVKAQWDSIGNPNAILTVYPRTTTSMPADDWSKLQARKKCSLMCIARIETADADAMVQYGSTRSVPRPQTPRLMAQFAGGFNFGPSKHALEVRNDPHTPYLFHGEEYSKAARLFTHGYDMYIPVRNIAFHWYEKRNVIWEKDWNHRYVVQQRSKRRIRHVLGLPVTSDDFDRTDLDKFGLGNKRTFEQFRVFSGIDPLAAYEGPRAAQFDTCDSEMELVPLDDS